MSSQSQSVGPEELTWEVKVECATGMRATVWVSTQRMRVVLRENEAAAISKLSPTIENVSGAKGYRRMCCRA